VDPMDSDQKWTYFRMLVDLVGHTIPKHLTTIPTS
jgi:hypothetical protein